MEAEICIKKPEIPQFDSKKELSNWVKLVFKNLGRVKIKNTGVEIILTNKAADRETVKRRSIKEENIAVFLKFKEIVTNARKTGERQADERHNRGQDIYYNRIKIDIDVFEIEIYIDKPTNIDKNYRYAGHKCNKIAPSRYIDSQI